MALHWCGPQPNWKRHFRLTAPNFGQSLQMHPTFNRTSAWSRHILPPNISLNTMTTMHDWITYWLPPSKCATVRCFIWYIIFWSKSMLLWHSHLKPTSDPIWPLGHITVPPKCNTKHVNWALLIRSYQKHANFGSTSILLWLSPQTSKWLKCRWRYIALMYGISSNHHRLIFLRWFTRRHHLHGWQC